MPTDPKTLFDQFAEAETRVREARRDFVRQSALIRELKSQGQDASQVTTALRNFQERNIEHFHERDRLRAELDRICHKA